MILSDHPDHLRDSLHRCVEAFEATGCERLKHGKPLCDCHDSAGRYRFATAQKSTRTRSDLVCSCNSAMFTSVLVRYAGITWTTPVGPNTCLPEFQRSLAKQSGRPKIRFVSPRMGCGRYSFTVAGVPAKAQLLMCCARKLQSGPVLPQVPAGCTVSLLGRLRGGSSTVSITLQPRLQKDKWSLYWKESMATKTDSLESITLTVDVHTKVNVLQQVSYPKLLTALPHSYHGP